MQTSVIRQWQFFRQPIELLIVFCFLLFLPTTLTSIHRLQMAIVIIILTSIQIQRTKLFYLSTFSTTLIFFNFIFLISILPSPIFWKSLLFSANLVLFSIYILTLKPADITDQRSTLFGLFTIISLFSGWQIINFFLTKPNQIGIISGNPTLSGFLSALGAIFFFEQLIEHFTIFRLIACILNLFFLLLNGTSGPFLIFIFLALLIALQKNRKSLRIFLPLLVILMLLPSPLQKRMTELNSNYSLVNFSKTWKAGWHIFSDHIITGVGADIIANKALAYTFPHPEAPANYQQKLEAANSDYLKIICECGISGLIFLILFFSLLVRKKIWKQKNSVPYLLFAFLIQIAFTNLLFHPFFFLLFLFLIRPILSERKEFYSLNIAYRLLASGLLLLIFIFLYLLPAVSDYLMKRLPTLSFADKLKSLELIIKIDQFNYQPYLEKAKLLSNYCQKNGELASKVWFEAYQSIEKSWQLNRLNANTQLVRAELYTLFILQKKFSPEIAEQIINALQQAEQIDPKNVFIKQKKAEMLLLLNHPAQALQSSLQALQLEPNFARALIFLQENFKYFSLVEYQKRLEQITSLYKLFRPRPGSYLYQLWLPLSQPEH